MKHRTIPWLLLTGLTVGVAAHASEPTAAGTSDDTGYAAGMKAAIDPATGKLRQPTAAEMRTLQTKGAVQSRAGIRGKTPRNEAEARATLRPLARGGYRIQVPEDRMSNVTATVQADGSVRIGHDHSEQEAGNE